MLSNNSVIAGGLEVLEVAFPFCLNRTEFMYHVSVPCHLWSKIWSLFLKDCKIFIHVIKQ
jgi:hypothetical protein